MRRLQDLLRREIPNGDPGAIVDRALTLLLEKVEKQKRGGHTRRATPAKPPRVRSIRPGADNSRHIPPEVQRGVCERDGDQCAFVSKDGRRCTERTFLEFHHIIPYALGGRATLDNISLRCRRHNQYEAELVFGPHGASRVREPLGVQWLHIDGPRPCHSIGMLGPTVTERDPFVPVEVKPSLGGPFDRRRAVEGRALVTEGAAAPAVRGRAAARPEPC